MDRLIKLYRSNIYGIIGTIIFHIILFSFFLLADLNVKSSPKKEEQIYIDLSDIQLVKEKIEDNQSEMLQQEFINNTTNRGSNRLSQNHNDNTSNYESNDSEYLKEVEEALNLTSSVSENLSKKRVCIQDIVMPVETTENQDPKTIDNTIYAGESTIVYYLENRYHIRLPIPVYLTQDGGVVVVDIVVNRNGKVVEAKSRKNNYIKNENTYLYAETAALKTVFNNDQTAPKKQKGTIHYTFIAQ